MAEYAFAFAFTVSGIGNSANIRKHISDMIFHKMVEGKKTHTHTKYK